MILPLHDEEYLHNRGFLSDRETFDTLMNRDAAILAGNFRYKDIGDYLDMQMQVGGLPRITERTNVTICPFDESFSITGNTLYSFTNARNESLTAHELLPHLIRGHQFFGGGKYRVAPEKLIRFFDIQARKEYLLQAEAHPPVIRTK